MAETALGKKLKALREASGRSRASVAAEVGVTYAYIQQLETGLRRMPRADKLAALAAALGVTTDELLDDSADVSARQPDERDARRELLEQIERRCSSLDMATLRDVVSMIASISKIEERALR